MVRIKKPKIKRNKPGPKGYFEPSMIGEVYKLARFGMTNQEIADFYEISISSIENYQRSIPEFKKALQKGRLYDSLKAVASLHKQVLGYEVQEREEREVVTKSGIQTLITTKTKYIQPNITATIYLLKTRHGDKWMDVFKAEFTKNINHHLDLSTLSNEDLTLLEKMGIKMITNKTGIKQLTDNVGTN